MLAWIILGVAVVVLIVGVILWLGISQRPRTGS